MHIKISRRSRDQLEGFTIVQRIVSSDLNRPSDKNENGTLRTARLHISGFDCVSHVSDLSQLADDILWSPELLTFKGHHTAGLLEDANYCFIRPLLGIFIPFEFVCIVSYRIVSLNKPEREWHSVMFEEEEEEDNEKCERRFQQRYKASEYYYWNRTTYKETHQLFRVAIKGRVVMADECFGDFFGGHNE